MWEREPPPSHWAAAIFPDKKWIAEVAETAEQGTVRYPLPEPAPYCRLLADVITVKSEEMTRLYSGLLPTAVFPCSELMACDVKLSCISNYGRLSSYLPSADSCRILRFS